MFEDNFGFASTGLTEQNKIPTPHAILTTVGINMLSRNHKQDKSLLQKVSDSTVGFNQMFGQ